MKALLWKDVCLLRRQLRLFLIAIVIFALIPSGFVQLFAVTYAAMLPYNTIALDEQSHWDQLAMMMPYSDWDVVLSKYLVGWACCLSTGLIALVAGTIEGRFVANAAEPQAVLMVLCIGLVLLALSLPLLFRFGVTKGRIMMVVMVMLLCGCAGAASNLFSGADGLRVSGVTLVLMAVIAAAANFASVFIAERIYRKKREM